MPKPLTENHRDLGHPAYGLPEREKSDDLRSAFRSPMAPNEGKRKSFSAKDVIYHESEQIDRVYLIRSGLVKQLNYLPNGRARIVRLHPSGHWLGLEGLLGQSYRHTTIAVDKVEAEYFSILSLRRLFRDDPDTFSQLLCQWHQDLAQADRWIAGFSTGGIKARLARLLEYLAELEYGQSADKVSLLSVHDMAEILGVTSESVSRILAGFKRCDLLQKQVSPIYQLDIQMLHQEARK